MQDLQQTLQGVVRELFSVDVSAELTRTEPQFGDFATNVALQLAGRLQRPPRDIAEQLAAKLREVYGDQVAEIAIAGPGFVNIRLSDGAIVHAAEQAVAKPQACAGKVVVTEYSDMNPFKQSHVGHLYTTIIGDVISRLYEAGGATVHRVNFGGDVGLHVAKTMWAIVGFLGGEQPDGLAHVGADAPARMTWLSARYMEGNRAYEDGGTAKQEIIETNRRVYDLHARNDHESPFAVIYWTCREWSYAYFKEFYDDIQVTQFETYYPESQTAPEGIAAVREQLEKGVYQMSDGAVIFNGEPYGLHTRVFINSNGLPTYETKDVGLSLQKWRDYHFDVSIIITGNDITEYMKVVLKSIEQFAPELAQRTRHVIHGNVKLAGGVKMSSRLGNGLSPQDVLDAAQAANRAVTGTDDNAAVLGAVKYAFLRQRPGADLIYDAAESVNVLGNSGPYLMYAHARARSILARTAGAGPAATEPATVLQDGERLLARKISEYPEAFTRALTEQMPHYICTYLYELAQEFNRFYEHAKVIGDPREAVRVQLITWYADVLRDGLGLLGIAAPEHM